ncbi:unnamed protein product [Arabidopsis arenosa]|uniref:DUF287 domain-containing protein n=1 Tax=Arabidopsis arenosa TaxID=38785 RepID=A0A8S2B7J9_ARAAE|nr:unnamed protein product [Arabidopsis arenosa]
MAKRDLHDLGGEEHQEPPASKSMEELLKQIDSTIWTRTAEPRVLYRRGQSLKISPVSREFVSLSNLSSPLRRLFSGASSSPSSSSSLRTSAVVCGTPSIVSSVSSAFICLFVSAASVRIRLLRVSSSPPYMARVIEGGREYESTERSREASTTDVAVLTEAALDASVQTEDLTDSVVLPTEFEPTNSAVVPTEFEPTDAAVIVPRVDASVLELSDREGKDSVRESNEDVCESDKEVSESKEKEKEVRELSIDGQGCDNEEEERVGDAEGGERSCDNEEEDVVAGVVKNIVDDIAAEEEERVNDVAADIDEDDDDEESQPLPPESMYFSPTEYNKADSKGDGNIEQFLLRIVDDVHACEIFPWGRYSFEQCMTGIRRMMKNMKGSVKQKAQRSFFGFITPLEIFAFECISQLGRRFREAVPAANDCPRMCKSKFTDSCMKGFTLDEINQALGEIKDISSILEPDMDEKEMLSGLVEKYVDEGMGFIDPVVESWREQLITKKKKIWWKSLYQMDLQARGFGDVVPEVAERLGDVKERDGEVPERLGDILSLQSAVDKGFAKIMEKFAEMDSKVSMLDGRVKELEGYVAIQLEKEWYNEYHPRTSSDFVPTYCTPTANQPIASPTKALVLHSGDEGDQEQLARKEKENKKTKAVRPKHSGPTIQTGKKRQRKPSRFQAEEFTVEGKGKGKKRQKK